MKDILMGMKPRPKKKKIKNKQAKPGGDLT